MDKVLKISTDMNTPTDYEERNCSEEEIHELRSRGKKKVLGYQTLMYFEALDDDEKHCSWSDCNHLFEEGDWVDVEMENGREGIYCDAHGYHTEFSTSTEIEVQEVDLDYDTIDIKVEEGKFNLKLNWSEWKIDAEKIKGIQLAFDNDIATMLTLEMEDTSMEIPICIDPEEAKELVKKKEEILRK